MPARKLHRSKDKLQNLPLRQVIDAAKRKKSEGRNAAAISLENQKSPARSKSNDTARLSFSKADEAIEERANELVSEQ